MTTSKSNNLLGLALVAILATNCNAFAPLPAIASTIKQSQQPAASSTMAYMIPETTNIDKESDAEQGRRSVLSSLFTTTVAVTAGVGASMLLPSKAFAEAESMERGGVQLTPFNSLAFNYRGGGSPTIDPTSLNEVSIPYSEFLEKLNSDQVVFVEFLAPNGDAAYATFKGESDDSSSNSKPIRIGEGYPVEDPEGWSSPAFVIKAVAKKGVPYKFVVPGLGDSFKL